MGQAGLEAGVRWLVEAEQQSCMVSEPATPRDIDFHGLFNARVGFYPGPSTIWVKKGGVARCVGEVLDNGIVKAQPAGTPYGTSAATVCYCTLLNLHTEAEAWQFDR